MRTSFAFGSFAFLGLACASAMPALAADTLLDQATQAQLERWLGAGRLRLDNVYSRAPGDTSQDFHAAADERGPTFVLARVRNDEGERFLVGGYNPQSWSSDDGWHNTVYDYQRTAFLFNFTAPAVYHQVPTSFILPSQGLRQTFNAPDYGPTFGAGHDLYFNEALDSAFSWQVSYGDPAESGASIIDRSTGGEIVRVDALDVFAISPVPEAAARTMLLGGLGVLMLGTLRRRT